MDVLTDYVQQSSFEAPRDAMTMAVLVMIAWSAILDWTWTPDGTTEWILDPRKFGSQIYIKDLQAETMEKVGFY